MPRVEQENPTIARGNRSIAWPIPSIALRMPSTGRSKPGDGFPASIDGSREPIDHFPEAIDRMSNTRHGARQGWRFAFCKPLAGLGLSSMVPDARLSHLSLMRRLHVTSDPRHLPTGDAILVDMDRFAALHAYEDAAPSANRYGFGLATFIKVKTNARDAFVDAMGEVASAACLSPGCIEYLVSGIQDDPDGVFVTEWWRSQEDQRGALQSPTIMALIDRCNPMIDHFEQKLLTPLA